VVSPGYIATPMAAGNRFHMPFLVGVDWAADRILRRLDRNPAEIAFPLRAVMAVGVVALFRRFITR
jgi:hypothetical protein